MHLGTGTGGTMVTAQVAMASSFKLATVAAERLESWIKVSLANAWR